MINPVLRFHEPQCERKKEAEERRREAAEGESEADKQPSYIDHIGEWGLSFPSPFLHFGNGNGRDVIKPFPTERDRESTAPTVCV